MLYIFILRMGYTFTMKEMKNGKMGMVKKD
jgi:hypothetical protein